MSKEISIKIIIADRTYPIRTTPDNEEVFRKAGNIINDKLQEYRERYSTEDRQDLLAMVSFFSMIEKLIAENEKEDFEKNITEKVIHINKLMSN